MLILRPKSGVRQIFSILIYRTMRLWKPFDPVRGFDGTIEFFPEEGKYHYDGHRLCGVSLAPEETRNHDYLCPMCGKRVTIGVMHRLDALADRAKGIKPKKPVHFGPSFPYRRSFPRSCRLALTARL